MATPELEPSWISTVAQWFVGIGASIWSAWKYIDSKFDKTNEHIEKLYQNAEADRRFTRDLHDKAMDTIAVNQREIMRLIRERQQ